MHAVLVWGHVSLMMVAFGASPMGRLGLRYLLSRVSAPKIAQAIARSYAGIFLTGGIAVTVGVCLGLALAWDTSLTQKWVVLSIALISIVGIGGFVIEDRWLARLSQAEGDTFAIILDEKIPFLSALVSPVVWLFILWLMIAKPELRP